MEGKFIPVNIKNRILYADRILEDEKHLIRPFYNEPKIRMWRAVKS
jgi:hypothetical protein